MSASECAPVERLRTSGLFAGTAWPVVLAVAIPVAMYLVQHDIGLSLVDEGFVWYGSQRVLAGELPIRDFQSYDLGRYYLYAAGMWVFGSAGITPLRAACAVLAALTVGIAAVLMQRSRPQQPLATGLGIVSVAVWLVPYYKVADSFAVLVLLAGLSRAVHAGRSPRCWFEYGACLGVASLIGINHALYGVLAGAFAFAYVWSKPQTGTLSEALRCVVGFGGGVVAGYLPTLVCLVAAPGFAEAFLDRLRLMFETGSTNLERQPPQLDAVLGASDVWGFLVGLRDTLMHVMLLAAPAFTSICAWRIWGRRRVRRAHPRHAIFVAATLLAMPYWHYVVSRTDLVHLAVSILPVLMAVWSCDGPSRSSARTAALIALTGASLLIAGPAHALFQAARSAQLVSVTVAGEPLRVHRETADELKLVQRSTDTYASGGRSVYFVPYWPGAYAVTGRRAPTWEIYSIFPIVAERQRREIERLAAANIALAIVYGFRMDGRADLGFDRTHPLIERYLRRCMKAVPAEPALADVSLYVAEPGRCGTR
jgi:hypothetical protein